MSGRPAATRLSIADLQRLYGDALETGADAAYRKRRWGRAAEFAGWLEQEALATLDTEQALLLYRASGGRKSAEFAATPIEELRDSLDFLLYDTIRLEGRIDECASPVGAYWLPGTGMEFVSWLLCVRNPALLGVWNGNAERMLKRLGAFRDSMNQGPLGVHYLDLMEALAHVGGRLALRDFIEVDILAWLTTRRRRRQPIPGETENSELDNALA